MNSSTTSASSALKTAVKRLVLALVLLAATACAAQPPNQVLTVWHTLQGKRERALLKLIDRFNATNRDGIVIVPERRDRTAQHEALLSGGGMPDLALVEPAQAAVYDQRGLLTQLDSVIESDDDAQHWDDTDRTDLFSFVLSAGRNARNQLIGIPLGGDVRVLLRNHDWAANAGLADMPTAWGEFDKSCTAAIDQVNGSVCFALSNENTFFEEWTAARGFPPYALNTHTLQIGIPEMTQSLSQLTDYLRAGWAYRAQSPQRALEDFASGRVSYLTAWSSSLNDITELIRQRGNFNIDVGTWPAPSGGEPAALIQAPLWVVPQRSVERSRSAWRFVRWLLEDEQTAQWAGDTGELPARASVVNAINLDASQPADAARAAVLLRVAPSAQPQPMLSGWPCVQQELAATMRQVLDGQSITETLTLAQAKAQDLINIDCSTR